MGVKSLPRICRNLIEHGMNANTPAATVQWGTTNKQRTIVGTVATLAQLVEEAKITPPALTIVGEVVNLRARLNWFERRPLFGQSVVVTRTREQASDLSEKLMACGAHVLEAPTIELVPTTDTMLLTSALKEAPWDWVIFTSKNGVTCTKQKLFEAGLDSRAFASAKIAAVGDATASAVFDELALKVDLCPGEFVAEALADALASRGAIQGGKFLLLRAEIARPVLVEKLHKGGAVPVRDVAIYETRPAPSLPIEITDALDSGRVHWVTFTSSSTARNFVALLGENYQKRLQGVGLASIGPVTTQTLRELHLTPTLESDPHTIAALVQAIVSRQTDRNL